jgi:hypothetical protein
MDLKSEISAITGSALRRSYVEACLLATNELGEISSLLQVPVEVLVEYEREVFPYGRYSRLAKLEYLETLQDESDKQLKLWAITQGFDFVKWRMGFKVEISPIDGMQTLYSDCIFKAKEAFFNHNDTNSSKEALKWVGQSMFLAKIIKSWVADSKEAMKDIEIALEKLDGSNVHFPSLESIDSDPKFLSDEREFSDMEDTMAKIQSASDLVFGAEEPKAEPVVRRRIDFDLMG